ncbi:MAG: class II aldolase/adducin family protein, partial [Pseudomonadota bacterium]
MPTPTNEQNPRRAIIDTCLQMNAQGINQGTSGNVSQRWQDGFLVSPSALPYDQTTESDIVFVDLEGIPTGRRKPSSEWRFHKDIYLHRPDIQAIVHTHSTYATALAIKGMEIPPLHYMVAAGGGHTIRCAPYATYGTQALSDHALVALEDRACCLLANHGVIATGPNLEKALWLAGEIEVLAQQYC